MKIIAVSLKYAMSKKRAASRAMFLSAPGTSQWYKNMREYVRWCKFIRTRFNQNHVEFRENY